MSGTTARSKYGRQDSLGGVDAGETPKKRDSSKKRSSEADRRSSWGNLDALIGQFKSLPTVKDVKPTLGTCNEVLDASVQSPMVPSASAKAARRGLRRQQSAKGSLGGETASTVSSAASSTDPSMDDKDEKAARRARRRRRQSVNGSATQVEDNGSRRRSRSKQADLRKKIISRRSRSANRVLQ